MLDLTTINKGDIIEFLVPGKNVKDNRIYFQRGTVKEINKVGINKIDFIVELNGYQRTPDNKINRESVYKKLMNEICVVKGYFVTQVIKKKYSLFKLNEMNYVR